jgi:MoaA/NifB/PqqE/SkfB family radical SAM enzyme
MADHQKIDIPPRLPLEGRLDLTHRCNNRCLHCWLWEPDTTEVAARELTAAEIGDIVEQARALGCREWSISGGEPMLRPDFAEVFESITSRVAAYTLNTNGTLVTPEIARLMRRRGNKMVAVYGATADVYDRVTRNPGGFEMLVQGLAYLREAGAGFTIQLIPMRANRHQLTQMEAFATSLSPHYRIGAPWLFKSACGDARRNAEIDRQRLDPADIVALDGSHGGGIGALDEPHGGDDRLYAACIERRRDFHIDPYGGMTFCAFVRDPALRFDLRRGTVAEAWEGFIPGLADSVRGGPEYLDGCAVCDLRDECRWCDVYGYLEHGRHGARVDHLCAIARESRRFEEGRARDHRRFYEIAGVTVQVESDLPFTDTTLDKKFAGFRTAGPGADTVVIRHHFGLPPLDDRETWDEVYHDPPWAIYRRGASWVYLGIAPDDGDPTLHCVAVFNDDHTLGELYRAAEHAAWWEEGGLGSLTMFPSDQILLARLFADRQGCFLHSGGLTIDGQGLLFVGHSEAGKSTTMALVRRELGERAEILCDDRNIVRLWPEGVRVHGTWSHGDVPDVSPASAPLRGILFLEQASENEIVRLRDRKEIWQRLLATLIRPMVTADWWQKEFDVLESIVAQVPFYRMCFDKSGAIVPELERLTR